MTRSRAAVVGLGAMGRHHARVLGQRPDVELVVVADPRDPHELAGVVAPSVELVRSVDEVVRRGVDLAVVAVPSDQHAAVACTLARHGVATLVEKPLAPRSDEARLIAAEFERAGVLGVVGHIERYNPALRELQRRLGLGEIGRPLQLTTVRHGPRPGRVRDVGVVMDLAAHDLDLGRWLLGCEYVRPAAATLATSPGQPEDLVTVLDQLPSGAVVSHSVTWASTSKERRVTVLGTDGLLRADLLTADLVRETHPIYPSEWDQLARLTGPGVGEVTSVAFAKPEPLAAELDAFVAAARGEPADVVTLADGLAVVAAAERVLRAAQDRRDPPLGP